ncbi:MAG: hypothetical protein ACI86H_002396 [bacterium]|jgi:hypothetical protein
MISFSFKNMKLATKTSLAIGGMVLVLLFIASLIFSSLQQNLLTDIQQVSLERMERTLTVRERGELSALKKRIAFHGKTIAQVIAPLMHDFDPVTPALLSFMDVKEIVGIQVLFKREKGKKTKKMRMMLLYGEIMIKLHK